MSVINMEIKHITCSINEYGKIDCENCQDFNEFNNPNFTNECNNGTMLIGTETEISNFYSTILQKCFKIKK